MTAAGRAGARGSRRAEAPGSSPMPRRCGLSAPGPTAWPPRSPSRPRALPAATLAVDAGLDPRLHRRAPRGRGHPRGQGRHGGKRGEHPRHPQRAARPTPAGGRSRARSIQRRAAVRRSPEATATPLRAAPFLTPNIPEPRRSWQAPADARSSSSSGPQAVLLKGGHLKGPPVDVLATPSGVEDSPRRAFRRADAGRGAGWRAASPPALRPRVALARGGDGGPRACAPASPESLVPV